MKERILFSKNPENSWVEKRMKQSRGHTLKCITVDKNSKLFYPNNEENQSIMKRVKFIRDVEKY